MTTPILNLRELQQAQSQPHLIINEALRRLEAACNISLTSLGLNAPPASPPAGAVYVVGTTPTGAWTGHANELAFVVGGVWQFHTPQPGWIAYNRGESPAVFYYYDGVSWEVLALGGGAANLRVQLACSDLTTPIQAGTSVAYFRATEAFTITGVRASLLVASSSGAVDVDVKKNGVSIFTTRVTIDATEKTSLTATTPAVISTTSVADDDEMTVDIVSPGDSPADAAGLIVTIFGTPV